MISDPACAACREDTDIFQLYPFIFQMEQKHPYIALHSIKVAAYSARIASKILLPEAEVRRIYYGALLHDIGKLSVDDSILQKPGPLTREEFSTIKQHPDAGARRISHWESLTPYLDIVRHHHERLDGLGYPDGLISASIPVSVRIVTIADAFDAMTSNRTYRRALAVRDAVRELHAGSGTQFDGDLVEVFERSLCDFTYEVD